MKTIAVGPFEPTESCVTGGTILANRAFCSRRHMDEGRSRLVVIEVTVARRESWPKGFRKAMI